MRSKYIRFFISSTFADMAKERNILQRLFAKLSTEYAAKEWQIEAVDLRWGISQEAGYDNKTMQICKSEIRRCQQLSPRPNFIVLLGNRYGWTPLPETIPYKVGKSLKMDTTEKGLFNKWYRLDENALPDGEYILQERKEEYRDPIVWFDEVEYPLGKMFKRNSERLRWKVWGYMHKSKSAISRLFGESATEQEIHLGALDIPDAGEHVIAYLRNLSGIPSDDSNTFQDIGDSTIQRLKLLKSHLETTLKPDNVLKVNESYNYYTSYSFDELFETEIEKRIRCVIDNAIAEYNSTAATTEDDIHLAIAEEEAHNFIGRAKELAEIEQYINDTNERRPLWIKSKSGSGKSALLAKIILNHQQSHHVVCRFCGRSAKTITTKDISFIGETRYLKNYLKELSGPTLIILDALNQLDDKDDLRFASLKWLDIEIPENIKIIISTTDELKFSHEPSFLKIYKLPDMGCDSEELVMSLLKQAGRRLTIEQLSSLKAIINSSDHSALFLHILGHYLKHATSWDFIDDTPSDLEGLVREMIHELTRPERHGEPIVGEALSFLALDRVGLTDNEMTDLLSASDYVKRDLEGCSFHPIDTKREGWKIPSVLWSRLRYDLSPFLRTNTSQAGQVTTIYHDELKLILFKIYFNKPEYIADTASRLFHYYKQKVSSNDTHALLEIIHSTIDITAIERGQSYIDEAADFLCSNLDFLLTKYRLYPQSLMEDFNAILPYFDGDRRNEIATLKRSLSSLPQYATNELHPREVTNEQLLLYMCTLSTNSILYKLASEKVDKTHVMSNLLSDCGIEDPVLYALSEVGEFPCMSDDGTKVASLFENRHNVRIANLIHPEESISLSVSAEVLELQCDDEMKYLAMRTKDLCLIQDITKEQTIFTHNIGEKGWMSISSDGQTFACGDVRNILVVKYILNESKFITHYDTSLTGDAMCGHLDPTGRYLWILFKESLLGEIDLNIKDFIEAAELKFNTRAGRSATEDATIGGKEVTELYDPHTCIPTCTANKCICFHDDYIIILCADKEEYWSIGYTFYCLYHRKPLISVSKDGQYLLTLAGKYQYPYCHLDKLGNQCELDYVGHSLIEDLECVNGDLSIGLRSDKKQIINIPIQLDHYESTDVGGVNSLSCSSDGKNAFVSYGKGEVMERKKEITQFKNSIYSSWTPPFKNNKYRFIKFSKISNNGNIMALGVTHYDNNPVVGELLIYDPEKETAITHYSPQRYSCRGITITKDSHYIITIYGNDLTWNKQKGEYDYYEEIITIIDEKGKLLFEIPNNPKFDTGEGMFISESNRYLVIFKESFFDLSTECLIYDLIKRHVVNEIPLQVSLNNCYYGNGKKYLMSINLLGEIIYNNSKSNQLCIYSPHRNCTVSYDKDMKYAGLSPSGRILYLIDKEHRLYKSELPFKEECALLTEHVKWIVAALDEVHLYIITDDEIILLYNIETKQIEERAYCGGLTYYQECCARGLYTSNINGDIFLFKPDDKYHVNIPAATSFIRRWNLETKEQEEPTAVCPMCGHQFGLSEELSKIIIDIPSEINYADWDNPQLKGHVCPHCGAQLQFNPYII